MLIIFFRILLVLVIAGGVYYIYTKRSLPAFLSRPVALSIAVVLGVLALVPVYQEMSPVDKVPHTVELPRAPTARDMWYGKIQYSQVQRDSLVATVAKLGNKKFGEWEIELVEISDDPKARNVDGDLYLVYALFQSSRSSTYRSSEYPAVEGFIESAKEVIGEEEWKSLVKNQSP